MTVSCTYNGETYSDTVEITVESNQDVPSVTVKEAIDATVGETVSVKGIVGPSLVNQVGFYLIDETGIIAVRCTADVMATLRVGYEVVITGTRYTATKGGTNYFGQSCINDATIVANYYGEHEYCDDFFVQGTTIADFRNLDATVDYSTTVFVLKAYVEVQETTYYSSIKLSDGNGTTITLYSSSAKQYKFLQKYAGKEVTVEIAACNWNDKNFWAGCVLSVILEDGSKVVNELNFTND